jgi:hypothetical protein
MEVEKRRGGLEASTLAPGGGENNRKGEILLRRNIRGGILFKGGNITCFENRGQAGGDSGGL